MDTRQRAVTWINKYYPERSMLTLRASRYYQDKGIWFFTFSVDFFDTSKKGSINILCESGSDRDEFLYLNVPFSFFKENRSAFDIRKTRDRFDLHISGKAFNWLQDERSKGISFSQFVQRLSA